MKVVYCANCGQRLNILRKALPKYARIIPIVEYHTCSSQIQKLDLTPVDLPKFNEVDGKNEFVQNLNGLAPEPKPNLESTLSDKRAPEHVKSCAPQGILDQIKHGGNMVPERELKE